MLRWLTLMLMLLANNAFAAPSARELILSGRLIEALPAARAEARAEPDDLDAQERYIDLLLGLGMASTAEKVCRDKAEADPESSDAHYLVGRAVLRPKRPSGPTSAPWSCARATPGPRWASARCIGPWAG